MDNTEAQTSDSKTVLAMLIIGVMPLLELFLIGLPKQMNNELSESEPLILKFIQTLKKQIPQIPIERVDERFTSKMAFQRNSFTSKFR